MENKMYYTPEEREEGKRVAWNNIVALRKEFNPELSDKTIIAISTFYLYLPLKED